MLSVFCYTEFAVEIPVAGNDALSNLDRVRPAGLQDYTV